jgi:hypothetical protein
MREVFFSDYLQKNANKSLISYVAWTAVALTVLLAGIAAGVAFIAVSGIIAVVVAVFVAIRWGPLYVTYRCGIRENRRSGPIFSRLDWATITSPTTTSR